MKTIIREKEIGFTPVAKKTAPPISHRIKDQLTDSVLKMYAEHIQRRENSTIVRSLWKIILAALVDTSDSDSESGEEQAGFPVRKCQHQHENSDNESDVTLMERHIMTQSRTMNIINV